MTIISAESTAKSLYKLTEPSEKNEIWKQAFGRLSSTNFFHKLLVEKNSPRSTRRQLEAGKIINIKMRNRLVRWLQEISIETFHFSQQTLVNSIQIVDEYLSVSDQHFSQLQLIGCASLYISAKINQNVIIAAQCYADCAGGIFSKEDLMAKERVVFIALGSDINFSNPLRIFNFFKNILQMQKQNGIKAQEFLVASYVDQRFSNFSEVEISLAVLCLILEVKEITSSAVLQMIQNGFAYY